MMRHSFLSALFLVLTTVPLMAQERVKNIPPSDFDRLYDTIKPQRGESPWREIKWVTNITEARKRAIKEDKPIVIFTAADGSPLSRT